MVLGIAPAAAQSAPTATEIFGLKAKCADLGRAFNDRKNPITLPDISHSVSTNYDFVTSNCYGVITETVKLGPPISFMYVHTLYDLFSEEQLASRIQHSQDPDGGKSNGYISDLQWIRDNRSLKLDDIQQVDDYFKLRMTPRR
jgi:hypothetical protein